MRNRPQENARNPCILLFKIYVLFYSVLFDVVQVYGIIHIVTPALGIKL